MPETAMFYSKIVPLDREKHKKLRLREGTDSFGFSAPTHIVPAVMEEFFPAAPHIPIVFMPTASLPVPVFIMGLRVGKNALVDANGKWLGDYIPAYVRRYPFIIGEAEGREPMACIDEDSDLLGKVKGEPLFDAKGQETPILIERLKLMNFFFQAAKRNEAFVKALADLSLFQTVNINARFETGESRSLQGVLTVDAKKLEALSAEAFQSLRKQGFVPAIYAHLASLGGIDRIRRLS